MNGAASSRAASSHANLLAPLATGFGGVWGSVRLKAARMSDAMPATMNVYLVPSCSAVPVRPEPRTVPSQSTNPAVCAAFTLSQSTRMNVIGQAAMIQPIVPPMRTMPNSFCASFICANAMELVIEIVGT